MRKGGRKDHRLVINFKFHKEEGFLCGRKQGSCANMAKVIMTCGKICSGKSTYSEKLRIKYNAVILSVDEITLALFGQNAGDKHDDYVERTEKYLFDKSLDIIGVGVNVVLDWGFWTKKERDYAKQFYRSKGVDCEFHFIDISDDKWRMRMEKRNKEIAAGKVAAYYVDDNLSAKVDSIFERPCKEEIDVWIDG